VTALKGTPAQGLWGATLGFFFGFASVALFGPTAFRLQEAMHLSPLLISLLVAAPSLSGSLLRIPFAAWVDTTGGRKPFLVLLLLSLSGMAGLSLLIALRYPHAMSPGHYPLLLGLGLLCGCGIATFSVGIGQVAYWFPQARQGKALGTFAGLGNLAPGLFSFLLPVALSWLGLAGSYLAWLLFLGAGTVLYALMGRNAWFFQLRSQGLPAEDARREARRLYGQEIFPAGGLRDSLSRSAGNRRTWALVCLYFASFGGFIALTAWFPTYWHAFLGFDAVAAGAVTAAYSLLTSAIRVAGGSLSDRIGGEIASIFAFAVMLAGAGILSASRTAGLSLAGALLMGAGMGVANAAIFKLVPKYISEAVGGAAGWIGGLGAFGGFAIPPALGWAANAFGETGYARGFLVFVALALLSMLLSFTLRRGSEKASAGKP
jgi:NNP family nitrate/nitrite transporter-like MFS transporter